MVAGQLDIEKKRTFDLIVSGNCKTGSPDSKISFVVDGAKKVPDFFDLRQGKIVFAEPHPMGTITMPKGHQSFVKISLQSINAENSEESQKWVCLGIRKKDAEEYLDYLYMPNKKETHIEMYGEDVVELVPLVSAADLSANDYAAVEPGKEIGEHSNFSAVTGDIKFSAVYRIDVKNDWLTELNCEMPHYGYTVFNFGSLGIGPIGTYTEDQMVGIELTGTLIHSSNGKTWLADIGETPDRGGWYAAPKYSINTDTWCAVRNGSAVASGISEIVYLKKGDTRWRASKSLETNCLEYGESVFMTIGRADGEVYTSENAITWTNVGSVTSDEADTGYGYTILICGDNKWICGDQEGNLYQSENTGKNWAAIKESNLTTISQSASFFGGCYANGYFYVTGSNSIAKSSDGKNWIKVADVLLGSDRAFYTNVTYYKGKLYAFRSDGKKFAVGMP